MSIEELAEKLLVAMCENHVCIIEDAPEEMVDRAWKLATMFVLSGRDRKVASD